MDIHFSCRSTRQTIDPNENEPIDRYNTGMDPAIFLDRDGVIIKNRNSYVRDWAHVCFYKRSLDAILKLSSTSYKIVLVTNQSAVGRGLISISTADEINRRIVDQIKKSGGRIDGVFMCPHQPDDMCFCRKPQPGLLFEAAKALSIDLKRSILIGDAISDIQAGQNAGIERTILVLTGRGRMQLTQPAVRNLQPFDVFQSLSHAVNHRNLWLPKDGP